MYAAPGTTVTSYKRSLSHGWGEKGKRDPKLPSVPNGVDDMTTPLASNKQVISGHLICNQPPLSNLDKSDKMDSDSSDSSSSSSDSESGSSSPSSSSSSSSESEKESESESGECDVSESDRSDFDEDFISGTDFEQDQSGPDLEGLDELAEGVNVSQRESSQDPRRRRRRLYRDDKGPFILEIDDETDEDIMR